jgi:YHS domain-containing protein
MTDKATAKGCPINRDQKGHGLHTACGRDMTANPAWYPRAAHQGQTIFFCVECCLETFNTDPVRFLEAHSKSVGSHPRIR